MIPVQARVLLFVCLALCIVFVSCTVVLSHLRVQELLERTEKELGIYMLVDIGVFLCSHCLQRSAS